MCTLHGNTGLRWATFVVPLVLAACVPPPAGEATRPSPRAVPSGVYRSEEEFIDGTPWLAGSCDRRDHSLRIDSLGNRAEFVVTHAGTRQHVRKADVFGAHDCAGRDLRFVGNRGYEILAAGPVVLYRYTWRRFGRHRTWTDSTAEYFSTSLTSDPIPLTKMNLKRAFPTSHQFHDLLDMSFPTDNALTAYDAFHGEYRLFRVFRLAHASDCTDGDDGCRPPRGAR